MDFCKDSMPRLKSRRDAMVFVVSVRYMRTSQFTVSSPSEARLRVAQESRPGNNRRLKLA